MKKETNPKPRRAAYSTPIKGEKINPKLQRHLRRLAPKILKPRHRNPKLIDDYPPEENLPQ